MKLLSWTIISTTCWKGWSMKQKSVTISSVWKDRDFDAPIEVFKCIIRVNEETEDSHIVNLSWSTFRNIPEWGANFVKGHPHCTFAEIQQAFCNSYWKGANWWSNWDEALWYAVGERASGGVLWVSFSFSELLVTLRLLIPKPYYCFLCWIIPIFVISNYWNEWDTLIEHKELVLIHEESGPEVCNT